MTYEPEYIEELGWVIAGGIGLVFGLVIGVAATSSDMVSRSSYIKLQQEAVSRDHAEWEVSAGGHPSIKWKEGESDEK